MPYRSDRKQEIVARPEVGPVAEMVRQFADPHAFVRELVQNSIDAGATSIAVRLERAAGIVTTSVRDDGAGMDRAVIEGPLLTLFNSSKEGDSTKIGKYGVGFVSVFAVDPDFVDVESWRAGECHRVRLYRDHRYELERLSSRDGSGTVVILHKPMEAERFDEFRLKIESALLRWCRYASAPIELVVVDHDRGGEPFVRRIDGELGVPSPLYVQTNRDGEHIVVGPSVGAERFVAARPVAEDPANGRASFAGFYNRGLTLFETVEPLDPALVNVRFRVDSPHLRHTLSRDNVLRDRAFHRLVAHVRKLVAGSLRRELVSRLARAARDLAAANMPFDEELVLSYVAFLEAALSPPFELSLDEILLPLAGPWESKRVAPWRRILREKQVYHTPSRTELSLALAQVGRPVLLAPHAGLVTAYAARGPLPGPLLPEHDWLLLHELSAKEASETDIAFCSALQATLRVVGIRVERVSLARPGAKVAMPAVIADDHVTFIADRTWLCPKAHADLGWAQKKPRGALLLDVNDMSVDLARTRAKEDVFMAAHLFARVLLLFRPDSNGKLSDRLFEAAAKELA